MSESSAKSRTMIDLDEFERRLRRPSAASPAAGGDPLAELARLVGGQQDPLESVFNQPAAARREPTPTRYDDQWNFPQPQPPQPRPRSRAHPLAGDFAAIEAGLRGSIHPEHANFSADARHLQSGDDRHLQDEGHRQDERHLSARAHADVDFLPEAEWHEQAPSLTHFAAMAEQAAPRSRRPLYVTAAIIVVGLCGIGASFALKGPSGSLREIAMIKAATGPTKVQAASSTDVPDQNASLLDKGPQAAPVALVNRTEQPVDLSRTDAPQADRPVRVVTLGSTQLASNAATIPVPPSPSQVTANPQLPPFGTMDMIEPKKVKTISVRPDGSPLAADTATAAQTDNGVPTQRPAQNVAAPKAATPKASSRVATTPKVPVAPDTPRAPAQDDPAKAQDVSGTVRPQAAQPRPVKVATADTDATSDTQAVTGRGFAVQLAAPGTEEEARQSTTRLGRQFASALEGHHLTFHHATVNDKSVYRVRVGGLSREEATALCEKLQASGGSCFVAKN